MMDARRGDTNTVGRTVQLTVEEARRLATFLADAMNLAQRDNQYTAAKRFLAARQMLDTYITAALAPDAITAPRSARIRTLLEGAGRFFGRILSFDCECPGCGAVYMIRSMGGKTSRRNAAYDPLTGIFRCPDTRCRARIYTVGLVFWHRHTLGGRPATIYRPPGDQVPTVEQALALRREAGGFMLKRTFAAGEDESNLTDVTSETPDAE